MEDDLTRIVHEFEVRDSGASGKGLFAVEDVAAGAVLYYGAYVRGVDDSGSGSPYAMNAYTITEEGDIDPEERWFFDGTPSAELQAVHPAMAYGSYVNESAQDQSPNCLLMPNPLLSATDIQAAIELQQPIVGGLLVTVRDICRGEELLTFYGSDYDRSYKSFDWMQDEAASRMYGRLMSKAYDGIDAWVMSLDDGSSEADDEDALMEVDEEADEDEEAGRDEDHSRQDA